MSPPFRVEWKASEVSSRPSEKARGREREICVVEKGTLPKGESPRPKDEGCRPKDGVKREVVNRENSTKTRRKRST